MIPCPLRRCEWARDGRCLFMLGDWCPNHTKRTAEEERIQRERALRAAEHAELMEMLRRIGSGQKNP